MQLVQNTPKSRCDRVARINYHEAAKYGLSNRTKSIKVYKEFIGRRERSGAQGVRLSFTFHVEGSSTDLSGTNSPVILELLVGGNGGVTQVKTDND